VIVRFATVAVAMTASLGGLYGGATMVPGDDAGAINDKHAEQASTTLRTDLIATPLILPGRINGYIIGRYVISYDGAIVDDRHMPLTTVITHAANIFFYRNAAETFWVGGPMGVDELADGLKMTINVTAGAPLVTALSVRQLDYLQSPEIRQPVISFDN
jgi:hypothetical protein